MKKYLNKMKYIKLTDVFAPFIFLIALPFSLIFRLINKIKKRKLWLVCEDGHTARDNGYHFYKYVRTQKKEQFCFYVIDYKSSDYKKVKDLGNIIQFKSFKHWVYYLSASRNISIHKHGNPNQPFFYVIHVILGLYNNRVFLQHGITKDDSPWLYYKKTKFRYFICGAKKEYEYIKEKFGYPNDNLLYTGFARFDNLHDNKVNKKQVLYMPTWRSWFGGNSEFNNNEELFKKTDFYLNWNKMLNDKKLIDYIEKNDITIYFYPHQHIQKFLHLFESSSPNIQVVDNSKIDIQTLLKESALLITDYSSVFMDFAYMEKPVIFFQFDEEEYREKHLQQGYFDYRRDGFGKVFKNSEDVTSEIIDYIENDYKIQDIYKQRMEDFFEINDSNNCQRIFDAIKEGD